ncbi:MAG: hypothetical protein KC933_16535 [Myxococcales bacterium]|nr:hypothetical protein [Myxococcales bacterium]MCB9651276.1 hypothetical protein [Deltaproteobacteria bacterium]
MTEEEEARRLAAALEGQPFQLLTYLSGQLSVLKTQAQMLLGLSSVAITVTGFSGAHMIRAGRPAALLMVVGIAFILAAATICIRSMGVIRWVTQDLDDDLTKTAQVVLTRRNRQQGRLQIASYLVAVGLAAYLAAVALAAMTNA